MSKPSIPEFYAKKNVLVTGFTGFLGSVLVEKLLRSCPDIGNIYVVIRRKNGKSAQERCDEFITGNNLFDMLLQQQPNFRQKIKVLEGDIDLPEMDLSKEDSLEIIKNVSIVFHSAANVKFNDAFKRAMLIAISTINVAEFCRKLKDLKVFVQISTAFANCHDLTVDEDVAPLKANYEHLFENYKNISDEKWQQLEAEALEVEKKPNTYNLCKAIIDLHVATHYKDLPVIFVRPHYVAPVWKEPMPGKNETGAMLKGLAGIYAMVGSGRMSSFRLDESVKFQFLPVDICANHLIAAAWKAGLESCIGKIIVYNNAMDYETSFTFGQLDRALVKSVKKYPSAKAIAYPNWTVTANTAAHNLRYGFYQILPALIFDVTNALTGKENKNYFKTSLKVLNAVKFLEFFATTQFNVKVDNIKPLIKSMSENDKKVFYMTTDGMDIDQLIESWWFGIRKYTLGDDTPVAVGREHNKKLYQEHLVRSAISSGILLIGIGLLVMLFLWLF